jgi:phosphotransacetylase
VRVLKELQKKDKRILLNDNQRVRLARKAKELTRKLLEETSLLFSPDTILGRYRRLIAKKYDGIAHTHKKVGRPNTYIQNVHWVLKLKSENSSWGSRKSAIV